MAVEKSPEMEKFYDYVAEVIDDVQKYKDAGSWLRFKSKLRISRLVSRYGLIYEAGEFKQMRLFNGSLWILGDPKLPLYLTAAGKQLYTDTRLYNEDKSLYILLARQDIMAAVSSATGEIVWLHRVIRSKWRKKRVIKNFSRVLTFNSMSGFISDKPEPAFEGILPDNFGAAKEFFDAARHDDDLPVLK